ncbi:hypothetical protein CP967_01055 [Streptomyces nitrosporeus]|uniref:Uncharacterized protein n=1 Tax=Streptomyces nitrosporeus TaxID=28894 RepID=A0A5J6F3K4_9ACTN|nr:DUF6232 family protein [Streptomyces nitrosporeus]QEU70732.1 hypothetical protein CP967_01055 [Streptomyces nitrosporeus]GGZ06749.1 hypothetical protein GCM10010327_41700 [Streptomyces nitrosporeus]
MPLPPRRGKPLELRVQRQILWVGSAAVPLRNVSWVEVFRLKPAWGKAAGYSLLLVVVAFLVSAQFDSTDGGSGSALAVLAVFALAVVCVVLLSSRKPVLVVELNSGSRVLLTLPTMDELRSIAGQIVYAIDHPEYEFSAVLEQYNTTNNFGSVVNMNGGRGNTGIKL